MYIDTKILNYLRKNHIDTYILKKLFYLRK
jgi:hypothetical protein